MPFASTVFITRHGERIDHVDPSWRDTADSPHDPFLTDRGLEQARALGRYLAAVGGVDHIFASPYYRTVQTAHEVAQVVGVKVRVEPGIREYLKPERYGRSPHLPMRSIRQLDAEFGTIDTSYEPLEPFVYPEEREDVIVRSGVTARTLAAKFQGRILFVAHGITAEFAARGLSSAGPTPYVCYCSLITCSLADSRAGLYTMDDHARIDFMNDDIKPIPKVKKNRAAQQRRKRLAVTSQAGDDSFEIYS